MENVGFIAQFGFIKTRRLPFTSSILWTIKDITPFGFYVIIIKSDVGKFNYRWNERSGRALSTVPICPVAIYIHEINLS